MPLVAQVAVSGATIHFDKLYSYLVPQSLAQRVHTGQYGAGAVWARFEGAPWAWCWPPGKSQSPLQG